MVKVKKKVNFNKIWKFIQEIDAGAGMFIFRDTNKKMTKKEKILALTWPTQVFLTVLLIVSTLVVSKFKLINVIFCTALLMGQLMVYAILIKFIRNKDTVKDIVKWCESLYDIEKKWHVLVQSVAEVHLLSMEHRVVKILKWFRIVCYFDAFSMTAVFAIVGCFLPETIYPKFSAPLPFYLPFKHQQDNWFTFATTLVAQTTLAVLAAGLVVQAFGLFFCIALHVLGYLDIIKQVITEKFKQELLTKLMKVEDVEEAPQPSTSKLQLTVLAVINQTTVDIRDTKDDSFDNWIKILIEMMLDVNSIINSFNKLFSEFLLFYEMGSLGYFFIFGLIFIVIRQQYFLGVGVLFVPVFLYVFCFINEKILDKFNDIKEALYDIPWYELTPKQQRTLLIALNCDEIQKGLTVAGIHSLTIERFAIIMKAGYTNLLVLRDLVLK